MMFYGCQGDAQKAAVAVAAAAAAEVVQLVW
jgi:hypothetical protein